MKRDRDATDSPPPKKSRKSDPKPDKADRPDTPEAPPRRKTDSQKNPYWELDSKRRVNVQEFKKTTYVGIRDYYEADGEMKPGKSGINLKVEHFIKLMKVLPDIIEALKEKGIEVEGLED